MKIVTSGQMKQIDSIAINGYGIPGTVLMENAGRSIAGEILELPADSRKRVALFAGKGNNGGDVMVAARHLYNNGLEVRVFLLAREADVRGDSRINLEISKKMGIKVDEIAADEDLVKVEKALEWAQVVVDGIFGTGLKGKIEGIPGKTIDLINESGKFVVAVDIPSGVEGDTGQICGRCVKADMTVTFAYPKVGLLQYPGAAYAGKLVISDISIPRKIVEDIGVKANVLTRGFISGIIPDRKPDAHKGSCGRGLIIGGSEGMTGAVTLASLGCLKTGAGLIKAAVPAGLNAILENKLTEVMTVPLGERNSVKLDKKSRDDLGRLIREADAIAIGPGMGVDGDRLDVVEYVAANADVPLVMDADALNCLVLNLALLEKVSIPVIITPHPGEMARLVKCSPAEIQKNRVEIAKTFSQQWRVITVLKGANSVIADPVGNIYINTSGNSGMASGGMGDVLTGTITSLLCQGMEPVKAACAGVYIHGLAGDILAAKRGYYGLTASEVAECLPLAIKETKEGSDTNDGKGYYDKGCYYFAGNRYGQRGREDNARKEN